MALVPKYQFGDDAYFTVKGNTYHYTVQKDFLNHAGGSNQAIFTALGIKERKYDFCSRVYRYDTNSGDFPSCRTNDTIALNRVIKALKIACDIYNSKESLNSDDVEYIVAESEFIDFVESDTETTRNTREAPSEITIESESVDDIKAKLSSYEEFLEKMLEGPYKEGIVISEECENLYRVRTGDGQGDIFTGLNPKLSEEDKALIKNGTKVLISNGSVIYKVIPEPLEQKPAPVEFTPVKWEQIGGLKSQVASIRETIELPLHHADLYKKYNLAPSRGVVLYGPPGCGKTLIAKAIASQFLDGEDINPDSFIYLKGGEMLDPYVGVTEKNIKAIFDRARANFVKNKQRSVIFIDEADALLPARGSRRSSDVEMTIVPTFLSEMDGFEDNATFIILATNFIGALDPAVIRPGRIDMSIGINAPDLDGTKEIFEIYLKDVEVAGDKDELITASANYIFSNEIARRQLSGAYIKNIVEKASMSAIKREIAGGESGIILDDITNSI